MPLLSAILLLVVAVLAAPAVGDSARRFRAPLRITELRPMVADVARERRPGDLVWAYWASDVAASYYGRRMHVPVDRTVGLFASGTCDERRMFTDLRPGTRIWLVSGALDPAEVSAPPGPGNPSDLRALNQRVARYAVPVQRFSAHQAEAVLYVVRRLEPFGAGTRVADSQAAPAGTCIRPTFF